MVCEIVKELIVVLVIFRVFLGGVFVLFCFWVCVGVCDCLVKMLRFWFIGDCFLFCSVYFGVCWGSC